MRLPDRPGHNCFGTPTALATAFALACSSAEAPKPLPTVLVTNASCQAGRCTTLEIRAFVWKFRIPFDYFGEELLGWVRPGNTCFHFPPSWTYRLIGDTIVNDTTGHVDTINVTWTPADTVPIYVIALDSAYFHSLLDSAQSDSLARGIPYFDDLTKGSVGETPNFAPGASAGWSVTFPSAPRWAANLAQTEPCKP